MIGLPIKRGDSIHIDGSQISSDGHGVVKGVSYAGMIVVFDDTGKTGYYTFERNILSLKAK